MASPTLKRPLEVDGGPRNVVDSLAEQSGHSAMPRADSPLSTLSSTTPTPAMDNSSTTPAPASKKRKFTPAEKEAARIEKERIQQEKAAQKAQREEEKQRKVEEKKAKDEEKEEKRRIKDAEKAAKDQERKEKNEKKEAERKAKDEEKAKKDKAQMRLTGFFGMPKAASPGSATSSRRGSVASVEETETSLVSPEKPGKAALFLPFAAPSHSTVAPYNRFSRDEQALQFSQKQMDADLAADVHDNMWAGKTRKRALDESFEPPVKRRRYLGPVSVKMVIANMQGGADRPIDLTSSASPISSPLTLLSQVPLKQFKYKEDVRPPYIGTYSKVPQGRSIKSLSRRPFEKALPNVDYDYDSEAEWEEPEEGEDLVSEGDEEEGDDEADEMDGFLDDDDADNDPRRRQVADVPPRQTDMHWESGRRTLDSDTVAMGEGVLDLRNYRIETLLEEPLVAIDPFSISYWQPTVVLPGQGGGLDKNSNMAPPRLPLTSIPGAANIPLAAGQSADSESAANAVKTDLSPSRWNAYPGTAVMNPGKSKAGRPPSQPLPPELMDSFKAAIIQNKQLTKVGLVEVLKSKFPGVSKITVTETLDRVAVRVGERQADKHWQLQS